MGGPSTGGGGGGVGPAGRKKDGTYGLEEDAKKVSKRNETRTAVKEAVENFEPLPVKIIKAVVEAPKKNKKSNSGDVYAGKTDGYNEAAEKIDYKAPPKPIGGNDGNDNSPSKVEPPKVETPKVEPKEEVSIKSAEQPKVKSQMDNTEIKSDMITADKTSPTDVEVDNNEILLKNKRKGRRKTILTSVTGVEDYPTLSRRTLLGG